MEKFIFDLNNTCAKAEYSVDEFLDLVCDYIKNDSDTFGLYEYIKETFHSYNSYFKNDLKRDVMKIVFIDKLDDSMHEIINDLTYNASDLTEVLKSICAYFKYVIFLVGCACSFCATDYEVKYKGKLLKFYLKNITYLNFKGFETGNNCILVNLNLDNKPDLGNKIILDPISPQEFRLRQADQADLMQAYVQVMFPFKQVERTIQINSLNKQFITQYLL